MIIIQYLKYAATGLKDHYKDLWNWIDSVILALAFVAVFSWIRVISQLIPNIAAIQTTLGVTQMESFNDIGELMFVHRNLCAFNFILIFFKLLKYLSSWFTRVKLIFRTLAWA